MSPSETSTSVVDSAPSAEKSELAQPQSEAPREMSTPAIPATDPADSTTPIPDKLSERKRWSEAELRELGISRFHSRSLELLADGVQSPQQAELARIPGLMDQFFRWIRQNYPTLDFPAGPEFQLTGYVMKDRGLHMQAGLLPEELADLAHGKDRGQEFWIAEQPTTYYREHLLLHEATHCLMNQSPHQWPVWYLEGMAEFFANHRENESGDVVFGTLPGPREVAHGFGRMQTLQTEWQAGRFRSIDQVLELNFSNFYPHKASYAWSWAFCTFLSLHPQTADRFPELLASRTERAFAQTLAEMIPRDEPRLDADWAVFVSSLISDYDFDRSRIEWNPASTTVDLSTQAKTVVNVQANRNWQASGVRVQQGETYRLTATGQFIIQTEPDEWVCEPQGVSVDYFAGRPAGELQLVLFSSSENSSSRDGGFLQPVSVGRDLEFTFPASGEIFFRINDLANDWQNNSGTVQVKISRS